MPNPSDEFRQQLLRIEPTSPTLREAYEKQMQELLHPPMTVKSALPGVGLLVALLLCAGLLVRAILFYDVSMLVRTGHISLIVAFVAASVMIIRDLKTRTHSKKSVVQIASLLCGAAGVLTVVALLMGLKSPSDPKSLFGVFYVFVFYFACAVWALEARIAAAELSSREQSLRIECRLADLAERQS